MNRASSWAHLLRPQTFLSQMGQLSGMWTSGEVWRPRGATGNVTGPADLPKGDTIGAADCARDDGELGARRPGQRGEGGCGSWLRDCRIRARQEPHFPSRQADKQCWTVPDMVVSSRASGRPEREHDSAATGCRESVTSRVQRPARFHVILLKNVPHMNTCSLSS